MMNFKLLTALLLLNVTPLLAQPSQTPQRSYLGVILDVQPIPEWLAPHLNLQSGQGIHVRNLHQGGPADQAGLEQDDIIIELDGQLVLDRRDFVQSVSNRGIGQSLSLTILRQGQRKELTVTLGPQVERYQPKYPPEPQEIQSWRPGRFFRFNPETQQWERVTPPQGTKHTPEEVHQYRYHGSGDPVIVIITGDPLDEQTSIEARQGQIHFQTTVAEINTLPATMRDYTQRALDQAKRKKLKTHRRDTLREHAESMKQLWQETKPENWDNLTSQMMDNLKTYTEQLDEAVGKPRLMLEGQRERLEELESQLQQALARIEKLETDLKKD